MNDKFEVFWDWSTNGNVAHIRKHDITPEQVTQVLERGFKQRIDDRFHPNRQVVRGYSDSGMFIIVIIDLDWVEQINCWAVYPVTTSTLED